MSRLAMRMHLACLPATSLPCPARPACTACLQRVQNMLLELAEAHTVDKASLQRLFQEVCG